MRSMSSCDRGQRKSILNQGQTTFFIHACDKNVVCPCFWVGTHRTFSSSKSSPPRIARLPRSVRREMFRCTGSLLVQKRWKIAVAVMVNTIRQITPVAGCQSKATSAQPASCSALPRQALDVFVDDQDRLPGFAQAAEALPDLLAYQGS